MKQLIETPTKRKTKGILLFLLVLILCFILPDLIHFFQEEEEFQLQQMNVHQEEKINKLNNYKTIRFYNNSKKRFQRPPSKFDPNEYSIQQWMSLGLSEKQAIVVMKFTRYKLKSNEDLKKIFVISDELYKLIKDSTIYPVQNTALKNPNSYTVDYKPEKKSKLDVNTATIEELLNIKGIGPFFAKQIIKKREELGGFYNYEQLMEVWKVDEDKLATWSPFLEVNPDKIQKLNINQTTAEELAKHPYISWNTANSIVKYKEQHGNYSKMEEIKKSVIITSDLYEKLKHYLTL